MIDHLDGLLRALFVREVAGITSPSQVRFQPPDDEWRAAVANLQVDGQPANALNVYLVDLRENRDLRSNERHRSVVDGVVIDEPAPARVDCHYLVTAWSPAAVTEQVEPALDEHALLYRTLAVLSNAAPLNPSRILPPGSAALDAVPAAIREANLPTTVVPVEGFGRFAEFWGTMGPGHRWRPALQLIVTLPVALQPEEVGPVVTATLLTLDGEGEPGPGGPRPRRIQIGGAVRDASDRPVPGALVSLETEGGERFLTATADALGRFDLGPLRPARYRLRVRAAGIGETSTEIQVPAPDGSYDVRFPSS